MEITEKSLKNILREQRKDIQIHIDKRLVEQEEKFERYIGVVSEEFQSQMKIIAESVSGIQEQLIALRDMVAKNTEDIESLKMDMEIVRMDLNTIKNDLKEKVSRDEFKTLERRVLFIEKKSRAHKFA